MVAPASSRWKVLEMVIGRDPDAHVCLNSKRASRQHAFLRLRGTDCMLYDNDSHNGVFLNGIKVYSALVAGRRRDPGGGQYFCLQRG